MSQQAHAIVYLTMKGGVGKTTLAANVTRAMADLAPRKANGQDTKILLIDADAQCNLTQIFLTPEEMEASQNSNLYNAFDSFRAIEGPSQFHSTPYTNRTNGCRIDLIAGSFETFSFVLATPTRQKQAEGSFRHFMNKARAEYDLIVFDTNPSATFLTLQALAASDFLVAPITFDSFSLRGLDLIRRELGKRHEWLTNPRRIRIVPNKIKRASRDADRARQEDEEQAIVANFPHLEESIMLSRIHESGFLDNRLGKRGLGFVVDQNVLPMHKDSLDGVRSDFESVGRSLWIALAEAFEHEDENQNVVVASIRRAFQGIFGGAVARP
jgi:chromosome partitioning protein